MSNDINECRSFLRDLGLENTDGWRKLGRFDVVEWLGLIEFYNSQWQAAAWKRDRIVWTG